MKFSKDIILSNPEYETDLVRDFLSAQVKGVPKRDGIIVGVSGGVDSAVVASLAVRAVGKENVLGLILPEKESNPISAEYAVKVINSLGIEHIKVELTESVASFDAYKNRDKVIKEIFPDYTPEYKFNIYLPQNLLDVDRYNFYTLRVDDGKGNIREKRLTKKQLLAITAAANVKIRSRMIALYYWGEQENYLVAGTTNKTEFILGDYCKFGDGGTDVECISHLYKTNIYELAEYLEIPREIQERTPSPDTFSLPVSDTDFYFCLPFNILDPLLYAWQYNISAAETASALDLGEDQVKRAFRDFQSKHASTEHIRVLPASIKRDWTQFVNKKPF
ncbi:MAG TPA: NAD(+) synthase [candidate division Zixibacteria bacterium]|nr:NAD(+) synthase [candidate division Zixibacteria bacterium]